jgi:hypothetical protein
MIPVDSKNFRLKDKVPAPQIIFMSIKKKKKLKNNYIYLV